MCEHVFVQAPPFSEQALRAAIADSLCWSDVFRRLGRPLAGGNVGTVKKYVDRWQISTDHFDPIAGIRRGARSRTIPLEVAMVEQSSYPRGALKKRLLREGILERRCCLCGQDEEWRGRHMSLILDHVNGVPNDHRLENLRIVCPNCAATLDTHCGRNPLRPAPRECVACARQFNPSYPQHRYCSIKCAGVANGRLKAGAPRPERRKVERPSHEILVRELAESNYSAVGRKYGVSDNAVRKWMRAYERERPPG